MDCKAVIKIEFSVFNSKVYKLDCWINYIDRGDGIDERVADFFEKSYNEAYSNYQDKYRKESEEQRKKKTEIIEKTELKRLREKYEKE